jgi:hypothetical protein
VPETLDKLRPDRDLQCYFERPSAIAALSAASPTGLTVSGTWRQQFDWAVVEWNRDNVFEHPLFRNLPDGNLSGLTLSYEETRTNCLAMDSSVYGALPWKVLRVWTPDSGAEPFTVDLFSHATPVAGSYQQAWCEFQLTGTVTRDDYIGLAFAGEHYTHQCYFDDTPTKVIEQLGLAINANSAYLQATWNDDRIHLQARSTIAGANGNRIGVYSYVAGADTAFWDHEWQTLHDGASPTRWLVQINFGNLGFDTTNVRKLRWTWAADLQEGDFERSEFEVALTNWSVTGSGRAYSVAGPGSRRIDSSSPEVSYGAGWSRGTGNFSGGDIAVATDALAELTIAFNTAQPHDVYLGTRLAAACGDATAVLDGVEIPLQLHAADEDALARIRLGSIAEGPHQLVLRNPATAAGALYFDFLELAVPCATLPSCIEKQRYTLATDWDTDHSIALAPERTAWMIHSLGFTGRANHYVGALWFYELLRQGHQYAVWTVDFLGTPEPNAIVTLTLNGSALEHLVHPGDTGETIATAFALRLNAGSTLVWAETDADKLILHARQMGEEGNGLVLSATPGSSTLDIRVTLVTTGVNGEWRTDVTAAPRLNRAVRDWTRCYLLALAAYGIEPTCALSMELQHGDPLAPAGLAQRYPSGNPVVLNTPAIQTNFSPVSLAFWQQAHLELAGLMASAGVTPYLQFGEMQWWYFPYDGSGMPFCDAYSDQEFAATYNRAPQRIANQFANPDDYPDEVVFYRNLLGQFSAQAMAFVRATIAACRFEVLYPCDTNSTAFNRAVNFASAHWTAATLDCLKTESFGYTGAKDLNLARQTIFFGQETNFPWAQRSHLVGISDPLSCWRKEAELAASNGVESVVLFALDQYCLIGYEEAEWGADNRGTYFGP